MELSETKRTKNYKSFVTDYYDLITKGYREVWGSDYFHPHYWPDGMTKEGALEYHHNHIFEKVGVNPNARVADFGCGIGAFSFLLAEKYAHVTAINSNKKQLGIARKTVSERKITNVEFIEADIMELSYGEKFDVVFIIDVDPHIPNKEKMLEIAQKSLKVGGKIILVAWCKPDKVTFAAETLIVQPFCATWGFTYMETVANYLKYFKKLGLGVNYYEDLTFGIEKSVHQGYRDFLSKVNVFGIEDVAKVLDFSMIKHINTLWDKAHDVSQMVLYSQAAYDGGLFIYPFYILEKK